MTIESCLERIALALELNAGIDAPETVGAVQTSTGATPSQAAPSTPRKRRTAAQIAADNAAAQSTSQTASNASPAATAPAVGQSAQSSGTSAKPNEALLKSATEAIIKLANEYSREAAVGILGKQRTASNGAQVPGVTRCSDLLPEFWQLALNEANAAIATAKA